METASRNPLLLPVLFTGIFMAILDVFIVNVAAPSMQADLGATASEVQWVVAAYVLAYAVALVTGGRLGDVVGRRRMFRGGLAAFTAASALCAAAPTPETLIGARVLQGLATAAMWPQVLSVIQVEFTPRRRPRAFAAQGVVQGMAAVTGQILGGALISLNAFDLGWRWVFLVNVPIGIAAWIASGRVVPESRSESARRLDLAGVALGSLTLILLLVPVVEGRRLGWPAWTFAALAAFPIAAGVFLRVERRIDARGGAPLVELPLLRARDFSFGIAAGTLIFFVVSFFLLLGVYLQDGIGLSAIDSGLVFTPMAIAFATASILGPRLGTRLGDYLPAVGAATAALGLITAIIAVTSDGNTFHPGPLMLALLPVGTGMGLTIPPLINLVLRAVPTEDAGAASGMLTTANQVGNALGVGIIGAIFFGRLHGTSAADYGEALTVAMALQAVLALAAAALVVMVRAPRPDRVSVAKPVSESA
jgi:EmrB/QacA subfamily drug resistance transporter